ncbi:MAG: Phosphatidylglycerophosphatase [Labilithrix sp.]|jgi:phosphatidylglycerophosphatase A|nr:Phosphatidylglycerophosphatase [Labilithrix sp.]
MKRERVAHAIAVWFGCGLSPVAPGTVGSLGALPIYFAVRSGGAMAIAAAALATTIVGTWAADVVASRSRVKDPQIVVVDEVAGTLIALSAAPRSIAGVVVAVALFRVFDIVKPFPARRAERLPGGWGIVLDDVVAGLQALAIVAALRALGVIA